MDFLERFFLQQNEAFNTSSINLQHKKTKINKMPIV